LDVSGLFCIFVAKRNQPKMKLRLLYIAFLLVSLTSETKADNLGYTKENPLIFGIDIDYPPLQYVDEVGLPKGFDVVFTNKLMKRLDIPYTYAPNSWGEIAGDVISGKVDLGMMVYSPYRKDSTNYSRAVFRLYYQILSRKGEKQEFGLRDIEGRDIALMSSRPIVDTLSKGGAKIHVITDLKKAVVDLSHGKYDGVICFRYQSRYLIEDNHITNLEAEDLTLMPREYCFVSHDKTLIDAINKELDKMENEGIIEETYADVKTSFDGFRIPIWVWFLLFAVIIVALIVNLFLQRRSKQLLREEMLRAQENEERAKKSEQLKDIFLSNISHSLRTPLNAIIGFSDLLMNEERTMTRDEQQNLLVLINNNGLQLLHLINELLSLSDIEGKQQLFERQVTDIDYEMSQYAGEIRLQLFDGVELEVIEPVGGMRAMLDPKLLRVVTMHLLENAQQHTKEGKITLSYYVKEGGIYVEVKDTGSGLPENLKDNIFSLLSDKNTYLQDETPGLGLSICKAIVDRTGGKMGTRDNTEDGRGSVIWFWAPTEILT
jgi:signal transduction histidine kinase